MIADFPAFRFIAAVSVGVKDGELLADLDYEEDSRIDSDINIVSTADGALVEVQSFCEGRRCRRSSFKKPSPWAWKKTARSSPCRKKSSPPPASRSDAARPGRSRGGRRNRKLTGILSGF